MDVVEDPETSGVAEAENEEVQGEQTELGLESAEADEPAGLRRCFDRRGRL